MSVPIVVEDTAKKEMIARTCRISRLMAWCSCKVSRSWKAEETSNPCSQKNMYPEEYPQVSMKTKLSTDNPPRTIVPRSAQPTSRTLHVTRRNGNTHINPLTRPPDRLTPKAEVIESAHVRAKPSTHRPSITPQQPISGNRLKNLETPKAEVQK
jgi:hypothetical protein